MADPVATPPDAIGRQSRVVNAAGLAQGIVLVTFPAASTIFTASDGYRLSSTQYGSLFLPQVVTAIGASLLAGRLSRRHGTKAVYVCGLSAGLLAMLLLLVSAPLAGKPPAFPLLLVATALVGVGFGLTVPSLNTLTTAFHPGKIDRAVLVLNALLGLGTALAPVFVALFVGLGFWWGLPLLSSVLLVVLLLLSAPLPLRTDALFAASQSESNADEPQGHQPQRSGSGRFVIFAVFAVLYGICETMNGNWAQLDMTGRMGASTVAASLALTAFWAMVTIGRVLFASIQRWFPTTWTYRVLPFVLAGSLLLIAALPAGATAAGVAAFGLAGLGCSALLPLTISFGEEKLIGMSASAAGAIIAFYQFGYGVAAFGAGPLQSAGVSLSGLFQATALVALALGVLSFAVLRGGPKITTS
ncbi:MAG: MFS transporter [Actinomycetes bacterium]